MDQLAGPQIEDEEHVNDRPTSSQTLIRVEQVSKIYGDTVPCKALDDISFTLPRGTFTGIIGPSGSGKTTLLNLLAGVDTPTSGTIQVNGHNIHQLNPEERAHYRNQKIGLVFQSHYLLPEFTVKENILMPNRIAHDMVDDTTLAYLDDLITTIGLQGLENSYPHQLSGGQQQRVAIARALINHPDLLLADEPGSNLDTKLTSQIYDLLQLLNNKYGMTVLTITHNRELVYRFSHILELKDGKLVKDFETQNSPGE